MSEPTLSNEARERKTPSAKKTVSLDAVLDALSPRGLASPDASKMLEAAWASFENHPQREDILKHVKNKLRGENCSEEFAERFCTDKVLRQRTGKLCRGFNQVGESMRSLEEAEIYTQLMDPASDDVGKLFDQIDLRRTFPGVEAPLTGDKLRNTRMKFVIDAFEHLPECDEKTVYSQAMDAAFAKLGLPPRSWDKLMEDGNLMAAYLEDPGVSEFYTLATHGIPPNMADRRLQVYWTEGPDGTREPAMTVGNMSRNPESDDVSLFNFTVARETRNDPKTGKPVKRRVLKDGAISIEGKARGKGQGMKFLMGMLALPNQLKTDDMEFEADISIGSYTWTRMAELDASTMVREFFPDKYQELGPPPWEKEKDAEMRAMVYREYVLPEYSQRISAALGTLPPEVVAAHQREIQNMRREFQALQALANQPEARVTYKTTDTKGEEREQAMSFDDLQLERLANMGAGLKIFSLNDEGELQPYGTPGTRQAHLGQAGMMDLKWYGRLPLGGMSMIKAVGRLAGRAAVKSLTSTLFSGKA